jgi:hypothetical protein
MAAKRLPKSASQNPDKPANCQNKEHLQEKSRQQLG